MFAFPAASPGKALNRVARILVFAAFTAVGAQLAVRLPFTPVPVTMQTLFVVLAGIIIGPLDAFYAMISYLAIGAAGAPVFSGFTFGPAVLLGPTGGYLLAFPAAAALSGAVARVRAGSRVVLFTAAASGLILILLAGTLHLSLISGLSLARTARLAAFPFFAGEAVKAFSAVGLAGRSWSRLHRD